MGWNNQASYVGENSAIAEVMAIFWAKLLT